MTPDTRARLTLTFIICAIAAGILQGLPEAVDATLTCLGRF